MQFLINTPEEVEQAIWNMRGKTRYAVDTETLGLGFEDNLFSIQVSDDVSDYYFNFHDYGDGKHLHLEAAATLLYEVFNKQGVIWFIHNAKFDMVKLKRAGIDIAGEIHCTQQMERLVRNNYFQYSLDACLKRRGRAKNDEVKKWITDNKAYEHIFSEVKGKKEKVPLYSKVPLDIMFKYGCQDTRDCYELGVEQETLFSSLYRPEFIQNERRLVKACFQMEWDGVKVNKKYINEAIEYEQEKKNQSYLKIKELSPTEFKNGPLWMEAEFKRQGIPYRRDPKTGNPIFDKKSLAALKNPLLDAVLDFRHSDKLISTYYKNFLHLSDSNDRLHANIRTDGTDTGRFSYWSPNLQNCSKDDEDESKYTVRSCIVPDGPQYCFVAIDYKQMEYAVMSDYAGEQHLINEMNLGKDVHQATADLMGVSRREAKTLNFMLLYGGGAAKLASALGLSEHEGKNLKALYFSKLPKVKRFIYQVSDTGKARGHIFNAYGRRYYVDDPNYAYKLPNYLIQGTCADIMRHVMVKVHKLLQGSFSSMKIQIHDELLLQMHKDEFDLIDEVIHIMENEYKPKNGIQLKTDVCHSWKSFSKRDLTGGKPQ